MGISILAPTRGATTPWLARKKLERHFNPRSREGSDDEYEQYTLFSVAFQSTLPRGERQPYRKYRNVAERFQSTLPRGERREHTTQAQAEVHFNPRSREGSDGNAYNFLRNYFNFNPRSREGSDEKREFTKEQSEISIHAPARGATIRQIVQTSQTAISIHAPARGATNPLRISLVSGRNFNPRSREGSDASYLYNARSFNISIHAPARGATELDDLLSSMSDISIHAPARGATQTFPCYRQALQFQSTLPRGERLSLTNSGGAEFLFQSTLPRGERRVR